MSPTNRKSRVLASVTAIAASAALVASGLTPPPANAANGNPALPSIACKPGKQTPALSYGDAVNCDKASPALLATLGDGLLKVILPDAGLNLSDLNAATAISLKPLLGDYADAGTAVIAGSGLASAMAVGGTANAVASAIVSAAISVGSLGGASDANALGGLALSVAAGLSTTSARALPLGIAVALGMGEDASATALGGVATATGFLDAMSNAPDPTKSSTICTALYGQAQVTDHATGKNYSSCTSVAFLFQKSQQGEGPVVYSIKNPFSLTLASPLSPLNELLSMVDALGIAAPFPASVTNILTGNVVPAFTSDLVRVTMTDSGPKFELNLTGKPEAPAAPAPVPAPVSESDVVPTVQAAAAVSTPEVTVPETSVPEASAPDTSAPEAPQETAVPVAPVDLPVTEPVTTEPATTEPATTAPELAPAAAE